MLLNFEAAINEYAHKGFPKEIFNPRIFIDAIISLYDIDERLIRALKQFEPFGPDNPSPVFASLGLEVVGCPHVVGPSQGPGHLKFRVREHKDRVLPVIAFGAGAEITKLVVGKEDQLDIAYQLSEDEYTGKPRLELKVKDIRFKTEPNSK
jgi:single-stranded-DNA-specific exonuclease